MTPAPFMTMISPSLRGIPRASGAPVQPGSTAKATMLPAVSASGPGGPIGMLAVGNANCGTGMGAYIYDGIYLNQFSGQNSGCAFGLADSLSGGQIVYNSWIAAPRLFNEGMLCK